MMRRVVIPKHMGAFLRDIRHQRKLTQGQVADIAGLRQATVSELECNAETSKVETLCRVIAALQLNIYIADKPDPNAYRDEESW